jgi:hypothetical protein
MPTTFRTRQNLNTLISHDVCHTFASALSRHLAKHRENVPDPQGVTPRRDTKSWLFCGSDSGGQRAAAMYTLIVTAKMNDADPQAWLADVLARIADIPQNRLHELLPWNWKAAQNIRKAA